MEGGLGLEGGIEQSTRDASAQRGVVETRQWCRLRKIMLQIYARTHWHWHCTIEGWGLGHHGPLATLPYRLQATGQQARSMLGTSTAKGCETLSRSETKIFRTSALSRHEPP